MPGLKFQPDEIFKFILPHVFFSTKLRIQTMTPINENITSDEFLIRKKVLQLNMGVQKKGNIPEGHESVILKKKIHINMRPISNDF